MARFEYHWIVPTLAQGSYPDPPEQAFRVFDVVAFCAEEHQPSRMRVPVGKAKILLPLDDDPYRPFPLELEQHLHKAAKVMAAHARNGRRVLTTCHMGMNRSGVMSVLTLMHAYRFSPQQAIALVRRQRNKEALFNPMFEQWLLSQRVK